jgi:hypothetical protein
MGQDDFDKAFNEIMGAQEDMPELAEQAPAATETPDGLKYAGDEGTTSVYHLHVAGRVVLHVLVDTAVKVEMPTVFAGRVNENMTAHPIVVATPDRSVMLPTSGAALHGRTHIKGDSVRAYIYPRAVKLMIRAHNIGL